MRPVYQTTEYGSFVSGSGPAGYIALPAHIFSQLEDFVLGAPELFSLSAKRGVGRVITAKNYVGTVILPGGAAVEILPKIYSPNSAGKKQAKLLLIDMLRSLNDAPYRSFQFDSADTARMDLFEIFIRMFIEEVLHISKRGLRGGYETEAGNLSCFRGKLLAAQQCRQNHLHKERFYVEYSEFTLECPENRLLKAALRRICRLSASAQNQRDIKALLELFNTVADTRDWRADYSKCTLDRSTGGYRAALLWCRVFLGAQSFVPFSGNEKAFALLFPMETLFERYIARVLSKCAGGEFEVSAQERRFYLFSEPKKQFALQPDIVLRRKSDGEVFVLDTKWKLLDPRKTNCGISQSDMYQLAIYQQKYSAKRVALLYPQQKEPGLGRALSFSSADGLDVRAEFIDLFNAGVCAAEIVKRLTS